jgi:hypothetical protein
VFVVLVVFPTIKVGDSLWWGFIGCVSSTVFIAEI